jgi:hypothetical protein
LAHLKTLVTPSDNKGFNVAFFCAGTLAFRNAMALFFIFKESKQMKMRDLCVFEIYSYFISFFD